MKTTTSIFTWMLAFMCSFGTFAQENNTQAFWIHEDQVKPAMLSKYEQSAKRLVSEMKKHNISGVNYITMATSDMRYVYIGPLKNMAELDQNMFAELQKKMGKEAFANLFKEMDKCYYDHTNYVLNLDKGLSYMPSGMTQTPQGKNYRHNTIYYVSPENYDKANEIAKKYHKLFKEKGSKMEYRVYRSGFGTTGTYFMVAVAAENPGDYANMSAANNKLLGEEGANLNKELMAILSKMETMTGWIRPDLQFSSAGNMTTKGGH